MMCIRIWLKDWIKRLSLIHIFKGQVLADSIEIGDNAGVETEFDDFKVNILIEKN